MMRIVFILSALLIPFTMMNAQNENKPATLNEKWLLTIPNSGNVEFEFLPNNEIAYNGKFVNEWISSGQGTYNYLPETGEVFIHISSGGFDWYQGLIDGFPIYYAESFSDYQLYFKITKMADSQVKAVEYVNSYYENIPDSSGYHTSETIWIREGDKYTFVAEDKKRMVIRMFSRVKQ